MMFTTARRLDERRRQKKRRKSHLYRLLCNRAVIGKSKPLLLNPCTWLIACSLNCNMDDDDDDDALVAPTTLLVAELPPPPPPVAVAVAAPLVVVVGGDVDPAPPGGPSRRSEDRVRAWTSEDISLSLSLSLLMGKRWCDAKTSPLFPIVHFISSLSCRHNKYSTTTTICSTHRVPRRFLSPPRRRRQSRRNTNNTNNVCGVVVRFVPIDGTKEEGELCDDDDAKTATR